MCSANTCIPATYAASSKLLLVVEPNFLEAETFVLAKCWGKGMQKAIECVR